MPWQGRKGFEWMRRGCCSFAEQLNANVKDKYHPQWERVSHSFASLQKCSPSFKLAEQGWDSQLLSKGCLPTNLRDIPSHWSALVAAHWSFLVPSSRSPVGFSSGANIFQKTH